MVNPGDGEHLELHGDTLAALQEFYLERDAKEQSFQDLKSDVEAKSFHAKLSMDMFSEDWNQSQFWYDDETATVLAKELLRAPIATNNICIVSAPSVFVQLKNLMASDFEKYQASSICLLEFDNRFDVFREFVHYDFQNPMALPGHMKGKYDSILCDPPFLSPDCQTKVAMTVRWLSKPALPGARIPHPKIVVCTGERMKELVVKLYPSIATTTFDPQHAQSRLRNDFRVYANFEDEAWSWRREAEAVPRRSFTVSS